MAAELTYDDALLDELARVFAEAALDKMLAEAVKVAADSRSTGDGHDG